MTPSNSNLTAAQQELLHWHYKLSHVGLSTVHNLTRWRCPLAQHNPTPIPKSSLPCIYNVPHTSFNGLKCLACSIARAHHWSPSITQVGSSQAHHSSIKTNHLLPGQCVSCDHYTSLVAGSVVSQSGYSSSRDGYWDHLYVDHASGQIFHRAWHSLHALDTLCGKQPFEQSASDYDLSIKHYHTDNSVFCSDKFHSNCTTQGQKLTFSGVGAHHQNSVAEQAIGSICAMARANMLHAQLCWPSCSPIDLWPLAMSYAIWVHIRLPPNGSGLSPEELWTRTTSDGTSFQRCHVFGCTVYVPEPALQDGKKVPKWASWSRQGIFVGFLSEHSSSVPLVLNPMTQHILPQYHVIFDDDFATVPSLNTIEEWDKLFDQLFDTATESYIDPDDHIDSLHQSPLLDPTGESIHDSAVEFLRVVPPDLLPTNAHLHANKLRPVHPAPVSAELAAPERESLASEGGDPLAVSEGDPSPPHRLPSPSPAHSPITHHPTSPVPPDSAGDSLAPTPALPCYPARTGRGTW
eukprot:CCRYP_001893-RA/>CCRYP_001893-RA protein AED:0.31 eAED:0.30 QI:0/0/0/1/0/0.33/3/0/518